MRLAVFSVQNFRSITKSEKLSLGRFTVLVGPNNEGKSNILQALVLGMVELSGRHPARRGPRASGRGAHDVYRWDRDFPVSLQEGAPNGRTILDFDFELTPGEIDAFHAAVGSRLNGLLPVRLELGDGERRFRVRKQRHSQALSARRDEISRFIARHLRVEYVPAVRTADTAQAIVEEMLTAGIEAASQEPQYVAAFDQVAEVQRGVAAALGADIRESLVSLLPDVASVHIDVQERTLGFRRSVRLVLDDGTATELDLKGDGVQSLAAIALIQHRARVASTEAEFVLAVEEPEAHLHPRGIRGVLGVLREVSERQQVIVTTHSPLLVNRYELPASVIVQANRARPASSVRELREVLGVETTDNLQSADVVLLVDPSPRRGGRRCHDRSCGCRPAWRPRHQWLPVRRQPTRSGWDERRAWSRAPVVCRLLHEPLDEVERGLGDLFPAAVDRE